MRYRILPYRQGSKGAKALADALGGRVLKLEGSTFVPREGDVVINWGNVATPTGWLASFLDLDGCVINHPIDIKNASNKKLFFELMRTAGHDGIIPPFWANREEIPDEAFPIVCRTVLAGHSGDGIVIATVRDDLVAAPLYVQYKKKKDEYRVHVGKTDHFASAPIEASATTIIAVQRKARRNDTPDEAVNWKVRNHDNGFVFVRGGVNPPADVLSAARSALLTSGLDFGAVDVIWNDHEGKAYVLEINTAPGLEGQTISDYAAFFSGG